MKSDWYGRAAAAVAGLIVGGLALAGPAAAQLDAQIDVVPMAQITEPSEDAPLAITIDGDCTEVAVTFTNTSGHPFFGDIRVDSEAGEPDEWSDDVIGEGPLEGEKFGDRYRNVDLPAGETVTETLEFEDGSGEHLVEAQVRRGPEQHWLVGWVGHTVDCGEPEPTPSASATATPTEPPADDGEGGELPETSGVTLLPILVGGGLLAAGTGAGLRWFGRRRRV